MAQVVALTPDLMFASRIQATLGAAGHDVTLARSSSEAPLDDADLLIADLEAIGADAVVGLGVPVLGFYRHTDVQARERGEAAGVDLIVPRSRMAREMPTLVDRLLAA
jgi:hypothetical protein